MIDCVVQAVEALRVNEVKRVANTALYQYSYHIDVSNGTRKHQRCNLEVREAEVKYLLVIDHHDLLVDQVARISLLNGNQ